jgi:Zn-dependent protease
MQFDNIIYTIAIVALPLMFAVTVHEATHGYLAYRLGDATARMLGRVTLNPIRHIDPIGTVVLPLILLLSNTGFIFGYAKPVPVNHFNFKNPKKDGLLVALGGPVSNLSVALASGILIRVLLFFIPDLAHLSKLGGSLMAQGGMSASIFVPIYLMLEFSVLINTLLAVFNLIPIPPLDGGRVLMGLLPDSQTAVLERIEPFGFIIILALIILDPFGIWSQWISAAMYGLIKVFMFM